MKIIQSNLEQIKAWRNNYFRSLTLFQELYLELMIIDSDHYLLQESNTTIGYAICRRDGILIEFYLLDATVPECSVYFKQVIEELSVKNVYCKSFDHLLLNCCLLQSYPYSLLGVLYRDHHIQRSQTNTDLIMKRADRSSVEWIMKQDDTIKELFETEDQLRLFIQNDDVFLFLINDRLVGCGTVLKTHKDWDFCDLGVWVHSRFRKRGIATSILSKLRLFAVEKGLTPSCGCAIDNIASQKAIEKSGFISKYKLISFKVSRL